MSRTLYPEDPILLVDDEASFLRGMSINLKSEKFNNVETCQDSLDVMARLKKKKYSLIFLDLLMPGIRGEELLPQIVEHYPDLPVTVLTAVGEEETAKGCLYSGAYDYLVKPVQTYQLINLIEKVLKYVNARNENLRLRESLFSKVLKKPENFKNIITKNIKMIKIFKYIEAIAESNEPVLITGETGVGKELIARAIHKCSQRKAKCVSVNIAGLNEELFLSTLFGHKQGAFTGAFQNKIGLVEKATNGTLFLDEIGDLSIPSQVKLLRLLQEREFYPLGSEKLRKTNARIILATNKKLDVLIEKGDFRKDFYHRLEYHSIHIPPLLERKEDIPILVRNFIIESARKLRKDIPQFPKEELSTLLEDYDFPGNIRELKSMIHDAVSRSKEGTLSMDTFYKKIGMPKIKIDYSSFQAQLNSDLENANKAISSSSFPKFEEIKRDYINKIEEFYLIKLMTHFKENKLKASKYFGTSRSTLERHLEKYGIEYKK